jgi:hypothetical protein
VSLSQLSDGAKHIGDNLAVGAFLASMAAWLIANAALIAAVTSVLVAIWTIMRMFESWQTILLNRRKLRGRE